MPGRRRKKARLHGGSHCSEASPLAVAGVLVTLHRCGLLIKHQQQPGHDQEGLEQLNPLPGAACMAMDQQGYGYQKQQQHGPGPGLPAADHQG